MKVSTSRAFRKQHLDDHSFYDFASFEDYFLYLHLNRQVQWGHGVAFLAAPMLPWSVYMLYHHFNPLPLIVYTALYYGAGFAIHWVADGTASKTAKEFGPAYFYALVVNFRCLTGAMQAYEAQFIKKYPHTLWVYSEKTPTTESFVGRNYPRAPHTIWLMGLSAVVGTMLTQIPNTLWWGWGLLYFSVFILIGLLCLNYCERLNDWEYSLMQELGDWSKEIVALTRFKKEHPEQANTVFHLQKANGLFWLDFKRIYLHAFRQAGRTRSQELNELMDLGKAWRQITQEKIEQKSFALEEKQTQTIQNLARYSKEPLLSQALLEPSDA